MQTKCLIKYNIHENTAKHEPIKKPKKCPPIILFGSAAILFGKAKTFNTCNHNWVLDKRVMKNCI